MDNTFYKYNGKTFLRFVLNCLFCLRLNRRRNSYIQYAKQYIMNTFLISGCSKFLQTDLYLIYSSY